VVGTTLWAKRIGHTKCRLIARERMGDTAGGM